MRQRFRGALAMEQPLRRFTNTLGLRQPKSMQFTSCTFGAYHGCFVAHILLTIDVVLSLITSILACTSLSAFNFNSDACNCVSSLHSTPLVRAGIERARAKFSDLGSDVIFIPIFMDTDATLKGRAFTIQPVKLRVAITSSFSRRLDTIFATVLSRSFPKNWESCLSIKSGICGPLPPTKLHLRQASHQKSREVLRR